MKMMTNDKSVQDAGFKQSAGISRNEHGESRVKRGTLSTHKAYIETTKTSII